MAARNRLFSLAVALLIPAAGGAAPSRIVLLGDSITAGVVSGSGGEPFATLLAGSLGSAFEVVNIGCGGSSSLDWSPAGSNSVCGGVTLPLMVDPYPNLAAPSLPADLVVVVLGTNDAIGFLEPAPLSAATYHAAIAALASALLSDGAGRVLLAPPPPNFVDPYAQYPLADYRAEILDLCGAPDDALLCGPDLLNLLGPSDFAADDVHPNAMGHAKIADALHDSIVTLVPEPATGLLVALGLSLLPRFARGGRRAPPISRRAAAD